MKVALFPSPFCVNIIGWDTKLTKPLIIIIEDVPYSPSFIMPVMKIWITCQNHLVLINILILYNSVNIDLWMPHANIYNYVNASQMHILYQLYNVGIYINTIGLLWFSFVIRIGAVATIYYVQECIPKQHSMK